MKKRKQFHYLHTKISAVESQTEPEARVAACDEDCLVFDWNLPGVRQHPREENDEEHSYE